MTGTSSGGFGSGFDPTRGLDKLGDLDDVDLKKLVRKPTTQPTDESIIDGVTHESIAEFVASQKSPGLRPVDNPGLLGRLRRRFGR